MILIIRTLRLVAPRGCLRIEEKTTCIVDFVKSVGFAWTNKFNNFNVVKGNILVTTNKSTEQKKSSGERNF